LKAEVPYKQYQTCFYNSFDNPFEKIVDNKTMINLRPNPTDQTINGATLIYYQGEAKRFKKIDNWLYEELKTQGLAVTLSNG
jgi:hypothetical protein